MTFFDADKSKYGPLEVVSVRELPLFVFPVCDASTEIKIIFNINFWLSRLILIPRPSKMLVAVEYIFYIISQKTRIKFYMICLISEWKQPRRRKLDWWDRGKMNNTTWWQNYVYQLSQVSMSILHDWLQIFTEYILLYITYSTIQWLHVLKRLYDETCHV